MWHINMEESIRNLTNITGQTLFGVPIQQTWTALYMLENLIREKNIHYIAELGTGEGALFTYFTETAWYVQTYDKKNGPDEDVFSDYVKKKVSYWIDRYSFPAMVFCDNGDKPREIREYAPMLRSGDFILGHDFGRYGGIPEDFIFEVPRLGLETYRQDEWDSMKTYILCMRKK